MSDRGLNRSCIGGTNISNTEAWGAPKPGAMASHKDIVAFPRIDLARMVGVGYA